MRHRADIDGLRAAAVLPIVAFHLGYWRMEGGYVGVDIFFVISGYLIGGILLDQMHSGSYSPWEFYARRFRRIVPALVGMLIATTAAVLILSFPAATMRYAESLIASMLSVSNFYFWQHSGYFDAAAETQPLLHTWSLAVEEQYYLLFPLILAFLVRRTSRAGTLIAIAALAGASLVASVIGVHTAPTATFYLLPTRIWELLLGVLAVEVRAVRLERRIWRESLALVGVGLIGASVLAYRADMPFPGLAAVPPCLGTAMLLVTGAHGDTLAARALALPPLRFFGLISYSLYLYHWPVIVLMKEGLPTDALTRPQQIAAFALSVALACLSWRYIEQPFRRPGERRKVFAMTGGAAAAVCGAGALILAATGVPSRFEPQVVRLAAAVEEHTNPFRSPSCFLGTQFGFDDFDQRRCLGTDPHKANVLLIGDSHAAQLWASLSKAYPDVNILQATASGCTPTIANRPIEQESCTRLKAFLFNDYLPRRPIEWVLMAGNWWQDDVANAAATVRWLRGHGFKVILVGPVVRYKLPLPTLLALARERGDPNLVDTMRREDSAPLDRAFRQIAQDEHVLYISQYDALCRAKACTTTDPDGYPMQSDEGHLTFAGARLVAAKFPVHDVLGKGAAVAVDMRSAGDPLYADARLSFTGTDR